jgi:hypothetical protein
MNLNIRLYGINCLTLSIITPFGSLIQNLFWSSCESIQFPLGKLEVFYSIYPLYKLISMHRTKGCLPLGYPSWVNVGVHQIQRLVNYSIDLNSYMLPLKCVFHIFHAFHFLWKTKDPFQLNILCVIYFQPYLPWKVPLMRKF